MCSIKSVSKIASYVGVPAGKLSYNNEQAVTRTTKSGTVAGFTTVLTSLGKESKISVCGESLESQCQVQQWIEYAVLYVAPGSKDKHVAQSLLRDLNSHLTSRSYFVDNSMTLADLAIFYAIYDLMKMLSPIEKENYLNLSRWFDHLQQNDKIRQDSELINFTTIYLHGWATGTHV